MEIFFKKKIVTSIMFIVILLTFSVFNFTKSYKYVKQVLEDNPINIKNIDNVIELVENTINENVYGK